MADQPTYTDTADPAHVAAFCRALARLVEWHVSPGGSDAERVAHLRAVVAAWDDIVASSELLALDVGADQLIHKKRVVFSQPGDGIASRLRADGIVALAIRRGASHKELGDLAAAFRPAGSRPPNLFDVFRRARWRHITFDTVAPHAWLFALSSDEGRHEIRRLTAQLTSATPPSDQTETGREALDRKKLSIICQNARAEVPRESILDRDPESPDAVFKRLLDSVARVAESPGDSDGALARALGTVFVEIMAVDAPAARKRIEAALMTPGEAGKLVGKAWRRAATADNFAAMLDAHAPRSPQHEALSELVRRHLRVEAQQVAEAVSSCTDGPSVAVLIELAHTLTDDPCRVWIDLAGELSPSIIRELLFSLPARLMGSPSGRELLGRLWQRSDAATQLVLAEAIPAGLLPDYRRQILALLDSDDDETLIAAGRALRRLNDPTTAELLADALAERQEAPPTAVASSLCRTLLAVGGDVWVDFLADCLGPIATGEGGLFGRKSAMAQHHNPIGDEAILVALARLGSDKAWKILKTVRSRADKTLKQRIDGLQKQYEGGDALRSKSEVAARSHPVGELARNTVWVSVPSFHAVPTRDSASAIAAVSDALDEVDDDRPWFGADRDQDEADDADEIELSGGPPPIPSAAVRQARAEAEKEQPDPARRFSRAKPRFGVDGADTDEAESSAEQPEGDEPVELVIIDDAPPSMPERAAAQAGELTSPTVDDESPTKTDEPTEAAEPTDDSSTNDREVEGETPLVSPEPEAASTHEEPSLAKRLAKAASARRQRQKTEAPREPTPQPESAVPEPTDEPIPQGDESNEPRGPRLPRPAFGQAPASGHVEPPRPRVRNTRPAGRALGNLVKAMMVDPGDDSELDDLLRDFLSDAGSSDDEDLAASPGAVPTLEAKARVEKAASDERARATTARATDHDASTRFAAARSDEMDVNTKAAPARQQAALMSRARSPNDTPTRPHNISPKARDLFDEDADVDDLLADFMAASQSAVEAPESAEAVALRRAMRESSQAIAARGEVDDDDELLGDFLRESLSRFAFDDGSDEEGS